jgi:glucose-6-phosphate 1-epimerase
LTSRVYHKVPSKELTLDYGDGSKGLLVHFRGFEDTTIWNPTESIGKDIADMEQGGWVSCSSCDSFVTDM